jgi:hypothetical protein
MRLLLTTVAFFVTLFSTVPTSNAQLIGATPWAVIKCKFSDQPQEPAFDAGLFTGNNGMLGYWRDVSYGIISLNGTTVHGWYTLPYTLAEAKTKSRQENIDGCIEAAEDQGVDLSQYYGVVAIINAQLDSGAQGIGRVLLDPLSWFPTFAGHEMGHGYGLDHSYDDSGVVYCANYQPGEYGDGWDIMSAETFGPDDPTFTGTYGKSGPGLNALKLQELGWLPGNRKFTWTGNSQTMTVAALNHPEASGYLMCKVPRDLFQDFFYYTIEFRSKSGWDRAIPQDTVLIHERRVNGLHYLIRAGGGAERLAGEAFDDLNYNVTITVLGIDSFSSTATVNVGRSEAWVEIGYSGVFRNGTFGAPFNTFTEGVNAVAYDRTVHIKTGTTPETGTINRRMKIVAYGGPATIGR